MSEPPLSGPPYRCAMCKRPVDPQSRDTWRLIVGWDRPGRAGGSDIKGRRLPRNPADYRWACDVCVRRESDGISPHQGVLT